MEGGDLCMSNIDNRVVEMKFNNAEFQKGVASTQASLESLNKTLKLQGATKGLEDISKAANNTQLGNLGSVVDSIKVKFTALQTVATAALATITAQLTNTAASFVKGLTLDPITQGFASYEQQINATQTVLANVSASGATLKDVTKTLGVLDEYANKTVFDFKDMAIALGSFTSSGIKLNTASTAIQGLANVAAAAGANGTKLAMVLPQISQALARGKVTAEDWSSVVTASMASTNFKNAILETAKAMGTIKMPKTQTIDQWIKKGGSFQEAMSKGQITSKVLENTLSALSNTLSDAQLAQIGYSKAQIKSIKAMAKMAEASAQNVKTFSDLREVLRSNVAAAWANVFKSIVGDLPHATKLFTKLSGILSEIFVEPVNRLNDFILALKKGGPVTDNLKTTFEGIGAIFHVLFSIVKAVGKVFFSLFSSVGDAGGGILALTAAIGSMLIKLDDFITKSGVLNAVVEAISATLRNTIGPIVHFVSLLVEAFAALVSGNTAAAANKVGDAFSGLTSVLVGFWHTLVDAADWIAKTSNLVSEFLVKMGASSLSPLVAFAKKLADTFASLRDSLSFSLDLSSFGSGVNAGLDGTKSKLESLAAIGDVVSRIWSKIAGAFNAVGEAVGPIVSAIGELFRTITEKVSEYVRNLDFQDAVALLNAGFFAAMYLALRKFLTTLNGLIDNVGKLVESISGVFDELTNTLKAMQQNVKSKIILRIAVAVSLLTAAVYALSKIDPGDLYRSLGALTAIFLQLGLMLGAINKWNLVSKGLFQTGGALVLIALAIRIMVSSIKALAGVSWGELIKGLVGIGAMLAALGGIAKVLNGVSGLPQAAFGLLILSGALLALSISLKVYASMDFGTIAKGLASIALVLISLAVALNLMPKGMVAIGAGLILVAAAIMELAIALRVMGGMSVGSIVKAIVILGSSMLILAVGVNAMVGALPGAAALFVVAAALALLTPVLITLGHLDWSTILKGLAAIALVLVTFGIAALVLSPIIPLMAALGSAMLTLGLAMLAAGAGMALFSVGLAALATVGAAGFAVLVTGFTSLLSLIPVFMEQIALGIIAFAKVISDSGPKIVDAITTVLLSILKAIDRVTPKLVDTIGRFILAMVLKIYQLIPKIARAGLDMIIALLVAIRSRIGVIVDLVGDIIVTFLDALARQIPRIIQSGVDLIVSFLEGIADAIENNSERIGAAGGDIAVALVKGMVNGLKGMGGQVIDAAKELANHLPGWVKKVLGINSPSKVMADLGKYSAQGLAYGLRDYSYLVGNEAANVGTTAMDELKNSISDMAKVISGNVEINPTITPVLDLSDVKREGAKIGSMLATAPISVGTSYSSAKNVSAGISAQQSVDTAAAVPQQAGDVTFIQNNTSPKALTSAEIYRQTRNQISVAKGVLTGANNS